MHGDLDKPVLEFQTGDIIDFRSMLEGCVIFGQTGGGKTSGPGMAILRQFLNPSNFNGGMGGLVLTVKKGEAKEWKKYCERMGRLHDFVVISPNEKQRFNFLDYEYQRQKGEASRTENIVKMFFTVLSLGQGDKKGGDNDRFWSGTLKQLLRNTIDLVTLATESLSILDMYRVILSAPEDQEEAASTEWLEGKGPCAQYLDRVFNRFGVLSESRQKDFEIVRQYWTQDFPKLSEKTRSIIVTSFTSMADCFLRGQLRDLFCEETNVWPEDSHNGKIIVIDLPVKEYDELGQYAQVLFKYIWQGALERREEWTKPCFLWADEAQFFANRYDTLFQSTARSSGCATVYLTQNLPVLYDNLGQHGTAGLLGNLGTKIFCCNGDSVTNKWASDTIGQSRRQKESTSVGGLGTGKDINFSMSTSEAMENDLPSGVFTKFFKGGPQYAYRVYTLIFQGGRTFKGTGKDPTSKNYITHSFKQEEW